MENILGIFIPLLFVFISSVIMWWSCKVFAAGSTIVGHRLPHGVRGATINAIGSSLPEFFTALLFFIILNEGVDGMSAALGTVVGSAIFNILIIPSVVIVITILKKKEINIKKNLILRDSSILILVQIIMLYALNDYKITQSEALILVLIYPLYVAFLFFGNKWKKTKNISDNNKIKEGWLKLLIGCITASFGCWICVHACEAISQESWNIPISFFNTTSLPGLNISIAITALVIAAAASSIPDLFISAIDAEKGELDEAIANPIGSNIFDLCIAFSVPLVLYTAINQEIVFQNENTVNELKQFIQLMIVITVLFLTSTSLWFIKKFTWTHVYFYVFLFCMFLIFIFNPSILEKILSIF